MSKDDEGVEWRVIWFPPNKPSVIRVGTKNAVLAMAAEAKWQDWHPIIERREVGTWEDQSDDE